MANGNVQVFSKHGTTDPKSPQGRMKYFDALPKPIRRVVNSVKVPMSMKGIYLLWLELKDEYDLNPAEFAQMLAEQDNQKALDLMPRKLVMTLLGVDIKPI